MVGTSASGQIREMSLAQSQSYLGLGAYAPLASPTFTGTVSGITKSMVGLGSVDNTTDLAKPISTATQNGLDLKANLASPALTGSPTAPTQTAGDNSTKIATTAYVNSLVSTGIFSGTFTFSGTGSATVFTFDDIDEAGMLITPTSAGAAGAHYLTGDNNGCGGLCNRIIITFLAAPASGTDNITFNYIKKL